MHLLPLVFYAAAAAAYAVHFVRRDPRSRPARHRRRSAQACSRIPSSSACRRCRRAMRRSSGRPRRYRRSCGCSGCRTCTSSSRPTSDRWAPSSRCCWCCSRSFRRSIRRSRRGRRVLQSPLFTVHVISVLFAYASFALAFVLGLTYVLLFKEIKAKQLGFFYARLPSLQALDKMNGRAITVGWICLTVGVAVAGHLGHARCSLRRIRARRRCRSRIPRFSSRCCPGACMPSRSCPPSRGLERAARRIPVGAGLRARAPELRAGRLLPHEEPQLLTCAYSQSV